MAKNAVIVQALCDADIPIYLGTLYLIKKVVKIQWLVIWTKTFTLLKTDWEINKLFIGTSINNKEN